jgi:hypothetical protein
MSVAFAQEHTKCHEATCAKTVVPSYCCSSGNAEDMFTSEGTGSRRAPSPLLELCRAEQWRLLAVQLPGRGLRAKEPPINTLQVTQFKA